MQGVTKDSTPLLAFEGFQMKERNLDVSDLKGTTLGGGGPQFKPPKGVNWIPTQSF